MSERFKLLDSETTHIPRERGTMNINGPSLIKVPEWVENPLGKYYLYFAHHAGDYIRLAYSDDLFSGWTVYEAGTLHLDNTPCIGHIASPDMHIMEDDKIIRMYFHGPVPPENDGMSHLAQEHAITGHQRTFVASSSDGINFTVDHDTVLGTSYFRVWEWHGTWYAIGMPGIMYRSNDGGSTFEIGPTLFSGDMRHTAIALDGDTLSIYYSMVGDNPERIRLSTIDLKDDWSEWQPGDPVDVLRPVEEWEGATLPLEPSARGLARTPVNQLRDPAIYEEDGKRYLLYSFAGEQGIGITQL